MVKVVRAVRGFHNPVSYTHLDVYKRQPQVVVRATYPGASPTVIAESVAMPLEESINGVEGMIYMLSLIHICQ